MPKRECDESRKKHIETARLNPKQYITDNQQRSPEEGNAQRSSRKGVGCKHSRSGRLLQEKDEDMIYSSTEVESGLAIHVMQSME